MKIASKNMALVAHCSLLISTTTLCVSKLDFGTTQQLVQQGAERVDLGKLTTDYSFNISLNKGGSAKGLKRIYWLVPTQGQNAGKPVDILMITGLPEKESVDELNTKFAAKKITVSPADLKSAVACYKSFDGGKVWQFVGNFFAKVPLEQLHTITTEVIFQPEGLVRVQSLEPIAGQQQHFVIDLFSTTPNIVTAPALTPKERQERLAKQKAGK